jgi:DNA-binding CsgD family transcriptional regulator
LTSVGDAVSGAPGRFAYEVELGRSFTNVRDLDSARAHYAVAATLADQVPDGELTLAYHRSRLAWRAREFDPFAPDVVASVAHPDPSIAMAALATRGWHHASLGDLRSQIADLRLSLAMLDLETDEPLDVAALAITCHSLARVAFEMADEAAMADVQRRFEQIAWSDGVAVDRFQILRIFGWDAFMRGRPGPAQWSFKDSLRYVPSTAWEVATHLDRAYVARIAGNEPWALEEIGEADRLAHGVTWESTFGEERLALLTLATLVAPANAPRAQRYASTFSSIGTGSVHPGFAFDGDRRTRAFARFTQGQIDAVLGQNDAAEAALREAYAIFADIGYAYKSAITALALASVTGDASWRTRAAEHASAYPNCPLVPADQHRGAGLEPVMPAALSPLQRQIAHALASGAEIADVSRALSRSIYTIERQVAGVYSAFGVKSRAEFLASARAVGSA